MIVITVISSLIAWYQCSCYGVYKQVIPVKKNRGAAAPPHSNYFSIFLRLRRAFAEVITFGGAPAHEL